MNSDLLNIINTGGAETQGLSANASAFPPLNRGAGDDDDHGVDDILGATRPRSLEDRDLSIGSSASTTNWLNLGRSQSAAPETWGHHIPSSTKSSVIDTNGDNGIFGRGSHFFDEEEEDREALMQSATRRPASTGIIGRPNQGGDNGDVNSILETLGLTSLEDQGQSNSLTSSPYSTGKPLGGIDSSGHSLVMGAHQSPGKKSIMEKIHEGKGSSSTTNAWGVQDSSNENIFAGNQLQQSNNLGGTTQQYQVQQNHQQPPGLSSSQGGIHANQYVQPQQQAQTTAHLGFDSQQQQQQQVYYQQQQPSQAQAYHTQDYRTVSQQQQQQANLGMIHGAPAGMGQQQQQTVYHINAPAPSYGFDYHTGQQHVTHGVQHQGHHIVLPHQQVGGQMHAAHGQPQYIMIQAAAPHHVIGGAPPPGQYAYVQYGPDGTMSMNTAQPTLVAGGAPATTFVMGPNGPIAVTTANPPGVAMPISYQTQGYHGHGGGSSPPGGSGRSPTRMPVSSNGMLKSPDSARRNKKNAGVGGLSSPRGKQRMDKNAANAPSKLGPEAAHLLNEIRAAKSRNQWTIHEINGHVVEFCLDQNGSRFIQQRLEVADDEEKDAVMAEIIPAIKELQNDVFGNYVVQKLYEFGNVSMKRSLKGTLEGNMLLLSLQMYGCRVVQKALESLDYDDLCELLREFDSYVLTCIQDQNGNHVMQKCIEVMSCKAKDAEATTGEVGLSHAMAEKIQFIVDDVLANAKTLCCHPYGCRVLQRMLEHCVPSQKMATLDKIQLCHKALLDDQYGNYVIQHVLQYGREVDRDSLLQIIVENDLLKLSRQKFASNVVEKLLKYGNSNQRNAIVREMLKVANEGGTSQEGVGSSVLLLMVRDAYANYVVQTAIDVVPEGNEKRMLLEELKNNEMQLRNYTFAKHIVAKLGTK